MQGVLRLLRRLDEAKVVVLSNALDAAEAEILWARLTSFDLNQFLVDFSQVLVNKCLGALELLQKGLACDCLGCWLVLEHAKSVLKHLQAFLFFLEGLINLGKVLRIVVRNVVSKSLHMQPNYWINR